MMNDEMIPWNIHILADGELEIPELMPLPEEVAHLLREKIAEHPELHGGDYIIRVEPWGVRWGMVGRYVWRPIYVGGRE